jgi:predicted transport protein
MEATMSFQAYLDTIKQKTGKSLDDFVILAREKGFLEPGTKAGDVIAWLDKDFGLGRGHAMALFAAFKQVNDPGSRDNDTRLDKIFSGPRAHWRPIYEDILGQVRDFGEDVSIAPTTSYVSFVKNGKKFAIVQPTGNRLDIGIKVKGAPATSRFEAAGSWNSMVTHRVRIDDAAQIDDDVRAWLQDAYEAAV